MTGRPPSSRARYQQYKIDLKNHQTEGSRGTAAAHAKEKKGSGRQRSFFQLFSAFASLLGGYRLVIGMSLLAVTLANLLLAASNDLAMMYLSLEMVSITSYVMVAYLKGDRMSNEASLKYVLFGAVSTGTMLYGLSLLYGLTGSTALPEIREALSAGLDGPSRLALYLITLLIFAGFGFKTAVVPFHFWCPAVYQGAP